MSTALAEREIAAPAVTPDQLELIKRTVANGATDAELKLFLYDCQRRGIHPLDKLLHFTKRGGKYTPVTSIDFMRSQAAMTGEMAGSDDAVFTETQEDGILSATVTVYRLTQGQRFAYAATARWSEYCPDNAAMWKRMPHTMLGKCAEALALRKAFPQQLAGLYSREEMDQSESAGVIVEPLPPAAGPLPALHPSTAHGADVQRRPIGAEASSDADLSGDSLPAGYVLITKVAAGFGKSKGFLFHTNPGVAMQKGEGLAIYDDRLVGLASECCQLRVPVKLTVIESKTSGKPYVKAIEKAPLPESFEPFVDVDEGSIPF